MYRIMVVSEDEFLREMVRFALSDLGAEVRCAGSEAEAEGFCTQILFDVVVVLTAAPFSCCCGFDAHRMAALRRPVVYVVAWQQSEQAVLSLLESGVDQYMTFPVNLQRLRAKIAGELEARPA